LRLDQPPSQKRFKKLASSGFSGTPAPCGRTLAEILPFGNPILTGTEAGALTVAGQWRTFTAFPSILAIAIVNCTAPQKSSLNIMKRFSMTSTFIAGLTYPSQSPRLWVFARKLIRREA
jgi:hypothetical protein